MEGEPASNGLALLWWERYYKLEVITFIIVIIRFNGWVSSSLGPNRKLLLTALHNRRMGVGAGKECSHLRWGVTHTRLGHGQPRSPAAEPSHPLLDLCLGVGGVRTGSWGVQALWTLSRGKAPLPLAQVRCVWGVKAPQPLQGPGAGRGAHLHLFSTLSWVH